jgi:hypothetical protein
VIYYLSTERYSSTVRHFLRDHTSQARHLLCSLTYEELFFERAAPIGHYIFTDFDRLSRYELECAAAFAYALNKAAPDARILNHPLKALERYPLLVALDRVGINDFTAIRIECRDRPSRYPVFIRAEDGYGGPETDLLHSDDEYDAAIDDLTRRGLPLRGRVAIGFANERSSDGYFYKYGAFNVGDGIVPHDRLRARNWAIKYFPIPGELVDCDMDYSESEIGISEELDYMNNNPHRDVLKRAFALAGIDFGRADYGIVNGRVQIYEINTNPFIARTSGITNRLERRVIFLEGLLEGLNAINVPIGVRGRVSFKEPRPRAHNLHWPRRRLPISMARRAIERLTGRTARVQD